MIQRSIHYKSDFKLRLANEIGWSTPFKLRFFTTRPVSAMEVSYDGTTYKGCSVDTEGKLVVTFDRFTQLHRQGLGTLMMELSYNIDDDQFADRSFDRILTPQKVVCIDDEDNEFELMLGLNGDSHVEVECSVIAAYKKGDPGDTPEIGENGNWWIGGVDTEVKADYSSEEALRQSQEAARVAAETTRQNNETQRQSGETTRQSNEDTRQSKETERQTNETARQNAEAQRQQTFSTNEAARQTAYQNAESNRNGAYEEAEQDRDEEFARKEATRDAANQAALNCAETLAALGPKISKGDAKLNRTSGIAAGAGEIPLVNGIFSTIWSTADTSSFSVVKVNGGDTITITGASVCGFLKTYNGVQNGVAPDYSSEQGYDGRITREGTYTTPSDSNYFIWRRRVNGSASEPTSLVINGNDIYRSISTRVSSLESSINTINGAISSVEGSVTEIEGEITDLEGRITTNSSDIQALKQDVVIKGDYQTISGGITSEDTFIYRINGSISAQSGYNTSKYGVEGLAKVKLTGKTAANEAWIVYAFYSGEPSASTLISKTTIAEMGGSSGVTLTIEQEIDVPTNAKYIVTCYYVSSGSPLVAQSASETKIKEIVGNVADALKIVEVWKDKVLSVYGDSVVQICNGDFSSPFPFDTTANKRNWANYTARFYGMEKQYGRGVGSQGFRWSTNVGYGGNVVFINSAGQYNSQNLSYTLDNYTGSVPSGCTAVRGCLASWKRITSQYPASIKDTIDVVMVMAHNDSFSSDVCAFVDDSTLQAMTDNSARDPEWMASGSDYYGKIGGDYNLQTFYGGIASTIMKLQMWMPQAIIILLTGISGRGANGAADQINTAINSQGLMNNAEGIRTMGKLLSIPIIDTFANDGINGWNRLSYIYNDSDNSADIVHPYSEAGGKMFARAVCGGLKSILPNGVFDE